MTQAESAERDATGLQRTFAADEVDLFLFSAACWLSHRIHYDAEYARSEGLADVPVHGPLQASWLAHLASDWARAHGGRLRRMAIRNITSAFPGDALTCRATITGRENADGTESISLDLAIDSARSGIVTSGSAVVEMPAAPGAENS
jgi:hydroxyacyl-ACP dehydratase HTD2-like protein with hotdog domain